MYKGVGGWERVGWVGEGRVGGWVGEGGVDGCEAKGGLHLPLGHRQQCCVFSKGQIQVQSTG